MTARIYGFALYMFIIFYTQDTCIHCMAYYQTWFAILGLRVLFLYPIQQSVSKNI